MKTVTLDNIAWRQIIDGLTLRAEQYEVTVEYYKTGKPDLEILEVSDVEEAQSIADNYRHIISRIRSQIS